MARKQRKMIQIADPDLFAKTKDVLVKFGEHLDGSRTITETRALAIMVRTAASFYGTGERLMLVNWADTQSFIVRTAERLADEVIAANCEAMSEAMGLKITFRREGQKYFFEYRNSEGNVRTLVYDKGAQTPKDVGVN